MSLGVYLADTRQQLIAAGVEVEACVDGVQTTLPQLNPTAVVVTPHLRKQLREMGSPSMS